MTELRGYQPHTLISDIYCGIYISVMTSTALFCNLNTLFVTVLGAFLHKRQFALLTLQTLFGLPVIAWIFRFAAIAVLVQLVHRKVQPHESLRLYLLYLTFIRK